jgi:hypothetical protein
LAGLDLPAREKARKLRALGITDREQAEALRTLSGSSEARRRASEGRTGEPGADTYPGLSFFEWIGQDARRTEVLSRAIAELAIGPRRGMFDEYQLPAGRTIADIGGSDGTTVRVPRRARRTAAVQPLPPRKRAALARA